MESLSVDIELSLEFVLLPLPEFFKTELSATRCQPEGSKVLFCKTRGVSLLLHSGVFECHLSLCNANPCETNKQKPLRVRMEIKISLKNYSQSYDDNKI